MARDVLDVPGVVEAWEVRKVLSYRLGFERNGSKTL
jgi:hypothetical protein